MLRVDSFIKKVLSHLLLKPNSKHVLILSGQWQIEIGSNKFMLTKIMMDKSGLKQLRPLSTSSFRWHCEKNAIKNLIHASNQNDAGF